jgi:hypothetical protein
MSFVHHISMGLPTRYIVSKKKPFIIPDDLDENCIFVLASCSLVKYSGKDFACAAFPEKEFVPSFDKSKEKTTLINMWASRTPADDAKIKITAQINIETKEITVDGKGFEFVVIHMYRLNKESKDVSKN